MQEVLGSIPSNKLPGSGGHTCNPSTQEWRQEDEKVKASLDYQENPDHSTWKNNSNKNWTRINKTLTQNKNDDKFITEYKIHVFIKIRKKLGQKQTQCQPQRTPLYLNHVATISENQSLEGKG